MNEGIFTIQNNIRKLPTSQLKLAYNAKNEKVCIKIFDLR